MLSICIPVYNFDVENLVEDLINEASKLKIEYEILMIDDKSENLFKEKNSKLSKHKFVNYIELEENAGRSIIRNMLAKTAKFDLLIFMDCDSKIVSKNYLFNYLQNHKKNSVVFGGRTYEKKAPKDNSFFRWKYGIKSECKDALERQKKPYSSFMTNNFMIDKNILINTIKFNENLKGYGHEDTLFGLELEENKIPIIHIDNPLSHIGLEGKTEFINKTEKGLENLHFIMKNKLVEESLLMENIKLLKAFKTYKKFNFNSINNFFLTICKKIIIVTDSVFFFNLYKLFYFARIEN